MPVPWINVGAAVPFPPFAIETGVLRVIVCAGHEPLKEIPVPARSAGDAVPLPPLATERGSENGKSATTRLRNVGEAAEPLPGPAKIKFADCVANTAVKVPDVVTGDPDTVNIAGSDKPTDVTDPPPAIASQPSKLELLNNTYPLGHPVIVEEPTTKPADEPPQPTPVPETTPEVFTWRHCVVPVMKFKSRLVDIIAAG
jgi:hypothetical protein